MGLSLGFLDDVDSADVYVSKIFSLLTVRVETQGPTVPADAAYIDLSAFMFAGNLSNSRCMDILGTNVRFSRNFDMAAKSASVMY